MTAPQPFFRTDGNSFIPTSAAVGPWDARSLHGRVVAGLLGAEIERRHGSADYMPARLTVDMYRLPDLSPITVETRMIRDGKRIKVVEAELFSNGVSMAKASSQLLLRTQNAPGTVWSPPDWKVPGPDEIPAVDEATAKNRMWEVRSITGRMGTVGARRLWMRELRDLVENRPITPFTRAALTADYASPLANAGDEGLGYINSDVTLYLHRLPVTEWIGIEVNNHHATDGVAIAQCIFYDEKGAIGTSSVAALAQQKVMKPGAGATAKDAVLPKQPA
jgi:acyl-CoA thioesterase